MRKWNLSATNGSLDARQIDLRTPAELSPYFRDRVLSTAVVQYVQD